MKQLILIPSPYINKVQPKYETDLPLFQHIFNDSFIAVERSMIETFYPVALAHNVSLVLESKEKGGGNLVIEGIKSDES